MREVWNDDNEKVEEGKCGELELFSDIAGRIEVCGCEVCGSVCEGTGGANCCCGGCPWRLRGCCVDSDAVFGAMFRPAWGALLSLQGHTFRIESMN